MALISRWSRCKGKEKKRKKEGKKKKKKKGNGEKIAFVFVSRGRRRSQLSRFLLFFFISGKKSITCFWLIVERGERNQDGGSVELTVRRNAFTRFFHVFLKIFFLKKK